ncbi:hypothetical protein ACFLYW_00330 [Thermodesulfobacteriota bacterium]
MTPKKLTEDKAMLTGQKIAKEQIATYETSVASQDLEIGNSRFGIGMIMVMAGFIGAWGCLCLINGIAQSSNMMELGHGIVTALTGI